MIMITIVIVIMAMIIKTNYFMISKCLTMLYQLETLKQTDIVS